MKQHLCKTWLISLLIALSAPIALAAEGDAVTNVSQCSSGRTMYDRFLQSQISYSDFTIELADLFMNACQYTAVKLIKDDMEVIQEQIKQAYLDCNNDEATRLRNEYNLLKIELFFARKITKTKDNTRVATNMNELKKQMKTRFVDNKKFVDEAVFNALFSEFTSKYDANDFLECKGEVEQIKATIESVRETIDAMSKDITKNDFETEEEADEDEEDTTADGNVNASKTELKLNAFNVFSKVIEAVSPQKVAKDIIAENDGRQISQLELNARQAREERIYNLNIETAEKMAKYKVKYQLTSDPISGEYTSSIDNLINTINATNIEANGVSACLKFVNETQCSE